MADQQTPDRFKTEMPSIPGVAPQKSSRAAANPALRLVGDTVVWRTPGAFQLNEVQLQPDERRALGLAISGASFEEVCAAFGEPARAYEALQEWLAEGWVAR